MNIIGYLTDVAQRLGKELDETLTNEENLKTHLLRGFNLYHKDFNNRYPWPWRLKTTTLQTVVNYKTGTVNVTNGSRTVTGNGTTFTSVMAGRFLKLDRDNEVYEILSVTNGTTLVLRDPFLGDTGLTLTYLIWKKYYDLDPDVPYLGNLTFYAWPHKSDPLTKGDIDSFPNPYLTGMPEAWAWAGINRQVSTYNDGSVTFTEGSRTLTGTGTSWLDNVFPGSKITISSNVYNVETVDSDTQITTIQKCVTAAPAGSTYSIETKSRSRIILSSVPYPAINISFSYFKRTYDLINDEDETELWDGNEHILTNVLYAYMLEKITDENSFNWIKVYEGQVDIAWQNLQEMEPIEQAIRYKQRTYDERYR